MIVLKHCVLQYYYLAPGCIYNQVQQYYLFCRYFHFWLYLATTKSYNILNLAKYFHSCFYPQLDYLFRKLCNGYPTVVIFGSCCMSNRVLWYYLFCKVFPRLIVYTTRTKLFAKVFSNNHSWLHLLPSTIVLFLKYFHSWLYLQSKYYIAKYCHSCLYLQADNPCKEILSRESPFKTRHLLKLASTIYLLLLYYSLVKFCSIMKTARIIGAGRTMQR